MHNNPKKYVITFDNHPNELGHKIIGENLLYLFEEEDLMEDRNAISLL